MLSHDFVCVRAWCIFLCRDIISPDLLSPLLALKILTTKEKLSLSKTENVMNKVGKSLSDLLSDWWKKKKKCQWKHIGTS